MFRHIGKEEHEKALRHQAKQLETKNQITLLQIIVERIKCPVGRPKLQPQMTLQSLVKHIKQDSEERTHNQESKKH
jgi:hypothetical protein